MVDLTFLRQGPKINPVKGIYIVGISRLSELHTAGSLLCITPGKSYKIFGERMKKSILYSLAAFVFGLFVSSVAVAADCGGGWRTLPNYNPSSGGPCAALGLDTHRGVCQPGQRYETLCDDASGGRYKTCQGSQPCYKDRDRGGDDFYNGGRRPSNRPDNDCRGWDYNYDQPCPRGYVNHDCRGGCEPY